MSSKRRRRRGLVAVGMSLVLALSVAPPVWASSSTPTGTVPSGENGGETSAEKIELPETATTTETLPTNKNTYATVAEAVNTYSFTISVPKKIVLSNTKKTGIVGFTTANIPKVVVAEADLAPTQIMTLYVMDTNQSNDKGNVVLKDKKGNGVVERALNVGFGNYNTTSWQVNLACTESTDKDLAGLRIENKAYKSGKMESTYNEGDEVSKIIQINQPDPIYAGHWAGRITFGVNVNKEDTSGNVPNPSSITTPSGT